MKRDSVHYTREVTPPSLPDRRKVPDPVECRGARRTFPAAGAGVSPRTHTCDQTKTARAPSTATTCRKDENRHATRLPEESPQTRPVPHT